MKILVILPFHRDESFLRYMEEFVPTDLAGEVDMEQVSREEPGGDRTKARLSDLAYSVPAFLNRVMDAERRGYNAVVMGCFADRGIHEARELVDIPVLGPTMVGLHTAMMLGRRLCILKPTATDRLKNELNIREYGFEGRVVMRGIDSSAKDSLLAYREYKAGKVAPFLTGLLRECVGAVEEDEADVIMLGSGTVMWTKEIIERELAQKGYIAPVVNPFTAALEAARGLVNLKLTQSRVLYPKNVVAYAK